MKGKGIAGILALGALGIALWYFLKGKESKLPCGAHGYGDIDDNGVVDATDVMWAQQIVSGLLQPSSDALKRADVDGDGVVTDADVALIESYANGVINTFPICG